MNTKTLLALAVCLASIGPGTPARPRAGETSRVVVYTLSRGPER